MALYRVALALTAVGALVSCQSDTQNPALRVHFPGIDFNGRMAGRLSVEDVRQINALIRDRTDIVKPIWILRMDTPDRAELYTGAEPRFFREFVHTRLTVFKRAGVWHIDESSIKQEKATMDAQGPYQPNA